MTLEEKIKQLREELDKQTEEELRKSLQELPTRIDALINKRIEDIVSQTLGMSNRWGRWEVDNCNGRQTAVANEIGKQIAAKLGPNIDEWVADATKKGTMPKGWKDGLRKEFDQQVEYQLRMFIKNHAAKHIQSHAEEMLQKVLAATPTQKRASKIEPDYEDI